MRNIRLALALFACAWFASASAQYVPLRDGVIEVTVAPSGTCAADATAARNAPAQFVQSTGVTWYCSTSTLQWTASPSGGGSGLSGLTSGRVPYATSATTIGDDAELTWDAANNRMGIGTAASSPQSLNVGVSGNARALGQIFTAGTPGVLSRAAWAAFAGDPATNGIAIETYDAAYSTAPYAGNSMVASSGVSAKLFLGTVGQWRGVFDTSGNFGIGDSTPDVLLDVEASANAATQGYMTNTNAGASALAEWTAVADVTSVFMQAFSSGNTSTEAGITLANWARLRSNANGNGLLVAAGGDKPVVFATNNVERMRLNATGLGIGKTPTVALDVNGTVKADGALHKIVDNVYQCGFDWDGDASTTNDAGDLKACLDAAKTYVTTNEDGTGNAVTIQLPEGDFDLSGVAGMCPYTLVGGMNIVGVRPRQQFVAGIGATDRGYPPDYDVRSNGGTWLSCGTSYTNTMFNGDKLRGVSIRDLGAKGFGTFYSSGGEQIEGTSYSHFSNLQLIGIVGSSPASTITAFALTNPHHIYAEHVNAYRVDTGWAITSWNCDWQSGNSLIVDSTLVNRARNTTDPLIYLRSRSSSAPAGCTESNPNSLNYVTFIRPQVMGTWNGFANSSIIKLEGASASVGIYGTAFHDVDIEGDADKDFWAANSVKNNYIGIAGCANDPRFYFESNATHNTIVNRCDRMSGYFATATNFVYGSLDSLDVTSQRPQGNWHDRVSDSNQTNTDELTASPVLSGVTGAVSRHVALLQPTLSSSETVSTPNFYGSRLDGQLNLSTSSAKANWYGFASNPRLGGSATGNTVTTFVGVHSFPQMGSSGTSTSITTMNAFRAGLYLNLGSNWSLNTACYFCADNALATTLPSGASLQNFYGLYIPDMAGLGATNNPIHVISQTGASASKGNIVHAGGGWNTGHVVLGDDHVWIDATNDRLRYKPDSAPSSETDGRTVVTSAASTTSGPAAWAANGVSCATACTNIGVANCSDSIPLDGTNTALGNCTGTTGHRVCECY